jgi:hypothetical protein
MRTNPTDAVASETLARVVERVTFHNPENGFCVLRLKARGQRDLITLVGHAATIAAGEFVQARGWRYPAWRPRIPWHEGDDCDPRAVCRVRRDTAGTHSATMPRGTVRYVPCDRCRAPTLSPRGS